MGLKNAQAPENLKMADSLPGAVSHTARQFGSAGAVTVGGGQSLTGQRPSGQEHKEKDWRGRWLCIFTRSKNKKTLRLHCVNNFVFLDETGRKT